MSRTGVCYRFVPQTDSWTLSRGAGWLASQGALPLLPLGGRRHPASGPGGQVLSRAAPLARLRAALRPAPASSGTSARHITPASLGARPACRSRLAPASPTEARRRPRLLVLLRLRGLSFEFLPSITTRASLLTGSLSGLPIFSKSHMVYHETTRDNMTHASVLRDRGDRRSATSTDAAPDCSGGLSVTCVVIRGLKT